MNSERSGAEVDCKSLDTLLCKRVMATNTLMPMPPSKRRLSALRRGEQYVAFQQTSSLNKAFRPHGGGKVKIIAGPRAARFSRPCSVVS
ncbi:hypothetical protein BJY00DRAFT_279962 [Aspergillus carlsbadensis]|nr:hypothetical protein BJY00DRAFT_279962 [Aspergillus carlsbadensis]